MLFFGRNRGFNGVFFLCPIVVMLSVLSLIL
jgi:hypothetical protein